jgi:hypothetical protein
MGRRRTGWVVMALLLLAGCGDSDSLGPNASLSEFVGDWEATALILTSPVTASASADLIALGSTFNINVQPSGLYTAVLVFQGATSTEIGTLSRSGGNTVVLDRTFPTASKEISTYVFDGSDRLILDGDTQFDFNLDGTPDEALAHFELVRR